MTIRARETGALRLGTRRSALALVQSGLVAEAVTAKTGRPVELVEITTYGDVSKEAITQIGGTGVFVSALRDALLADEVDFAVHSLKDLPTAAPAGLALAAVPEREDVRDVLVARDDLKFADLPSGARVGTGSSRRAAQLRMLRSDLKIVPVRGNVDTRVGFVTKGTLDAVVLAYAGLSRLGRIGEATDYFDPMALLPAPGQGALAVECRAADGELVAATGRAGPRPDQGRGRCRARAASDARSGVFGPGRRLRRRGRARTATDRDRRRGRGRGRDAGRRAPVDQDVRHRNRGRGRAARA